MNPQTTSAFVFAGSAVVILGILAAVILLIIKSRRQIKASKDTLEQLGFVIEKKPDSELKRAAFAAVGAPKALHHGHSNIKWVGVAEIESRRVTLLTHAYTVHTGHAMIVIQHIVIGIACPVLLGTVTIAPRNGLRRWFCEKLGLAPKPANWQRELALRFLLNPDKFPRVADALANPDAQAALALLPKGASLNLADGVVSLSQQAEPRPEVIQPLLESVLRIADVLGSSEQRPV